MTQPYIWCGHCETVQPLLEDKMWGNDSAGKGFINPTDLMCAKCHLVIATTWDCNYAPPRINGITGETMRIFAGEQALPSGVRSYHVLPTITFVDARGDTKFAGGHNYSATVSWLLWGLTVCFGR